MVDKGSVALRTGANYNKILFAKEKLQTVSNWHEIWTEVVDDCAECEAVAPRGREIGDLDSWVVPCDLLTPLQEVLARRGVVQYRQSTVLRLHNEPTNLHSFSTTDKITTKGFNAQTLQNQQCQYYNILDLPVHTATNSLLHSRIKLDSFKL